jgi:integrase
VCDPRSLADDIRLEERSLRGARNDRRGQISTTKGWRIRHVPMSARLTEALRGHRHLRGPLVLYRPDGRPLTDSFVREAVGRAAKKAGLTNNRPHILRRTFCSHLAMRGAIGAWLRRVEAIRYAA